MKINPPQSFNPFKAVSLAALCLGSSTLAMAGPSVPATILTQPPAESFWTQKYLTGDWGGERTRLENEGIKITANHVGDFEADVAGNHTHHGTWFGRFRLSLDVDLQKLANIDGEFYATAIYQYGQNLSGKYLNVNTLTSSIAGTPSLRVDEIWYQQGLFDGRVKIKLGQVAAVNEFGSTDFGDVMINDETGYAPNAIFPTAQPFSPAGKPGVIVKFDLRDLTPGLYFKAGAFTGYRDSYHPDRNGFDYASDFDRGPAYSAEIGYNEQNPNYAGVYKLGANYNDLKGYSDLYTGEPLRGDYNVYLTVEKSVYHPRQLVSDGKSMNEVLDTKKGLDLLLELVGAPDDRNPIEFEALFAARYTGLIPGRDTDKVGFGVIYSQTGHAVSAASKAAGGSSLNGEVDLELSYQVNPTPWLSIQPNVQAIFNPRGDSNRNNIVVLGLRSVVTF
jgi:porin